MNRYERHADLDDAVRIALEGWQAGIFTADVGIVDSFDAAAQTCSVTLATQQQIRNKDDSWTWVTLPLLVDVPVVFPAGGGYTLTFPVVKGDECVVIFAQRCIDGWWQSGGVQQQMELRFHDPSDAMALVGLRSQPRRLAPAPSAASAQLRSDDGLTFVEVGAGTIKLKAPISVTIDSPDTFITGKLAVQGLFSFYGGVNGSGGTGSTMNIVGNVNFTGLLANNSKSVGSTHTHPVTSAPGTTGAPT